MASVVMDSSSSISIEVNTDAVQVVETVEETDPTVYDWAKAAEKPTYTAEEVGALPDTTVIPTTTSELTNDSGFLTSDDIDTALDTSSGNAVANSAVSTEIETIETNVNTLETSVSTLQTDVGTLQTDVSTAQTDIDTLETSVGTLQTSVGTLQTDVDTAEADIDTLEASMTTAQTDIDTLETTVETLAPLASPALTGTPTAPTPSDSDNSTTIATTAFVTTKVNEVISAGIDYQVVTELPSTGSVGIIYLLPNGGSGLNQYDEYIYSTDLVSFEKIGTTEVDLTPYMQEDEAEDITTTEIDSMWEGTYSE